jgi:cytosol alanyl aminopeptidase
VPVNRRIALALATCSVAIGAAHAADAPIGRLGNDVVPVAESIALDVDPRLPDYAGSVDVGIEVRKPTRTFRFHARSIEISKLTIERQGGGAPPIQVTHKALADEMIEAATDVEMPKGRYTMHIDFHNRFDTEAKGLYRLHVAGEWYAFTQFEAIDAREAFPCWDEPGFKIPYRVTLTVPAADAAIANTGEDSAVEKNGKRTVVFKTTRPLPAYLLAVATGPLEFVPVPGTSIPTRIVTTKGQSSLAGEAVATTPALLAALERYFGARYPYDKLDLIAVPEYWYGAMENPGAITYLDRVLLLDPKAVTAAAREHLIVDTAHEIAHMWFGDLVTMAWWDDLWLNESFASWMEDKITGEVHPEFGSEIDEVGSAQRVMRLDSLLSTRAMRRPVDSVSSLLQSADDLAYSKGSAVLHMVEAWIGSDAFRNGVLAYLKDHADATATGDDLWRALSSASGQDVKAALSSFLDQPGVPLVTVEPLSGGRVRLTQSRFLNFGAQSPHPQTWKIPVMLRYPSGKETAVKRVLLTKPEQIVTLAGKQTPAWVYPNANESGYYRWSVPPAVLTRLTKEAGAVLATRERVGLLGNATALLNAGQLAGADFVKVLEAFASDPDPQVVEDVVRGLSTMRATFFAEGHDAEFAPFVRRTLAPALQRFGTVKREGEPLPVTGLRPRLLETLGDAGGDEAVRAEMEHLASAYLADPAAIDPSLADVSVSLSAIRGDVAMFDRYRARFETAKVPAERLRFLSALGNFRDPALVDRALLYVFTGPLRPQEVMVIPRAQAAIPAQRAKTFAWFTAHYDELAARIPSDFMVFMPHLADGCSIARVDAAKTFFADPKHAPPGTSEELANVVESVGDCAGLDAREGASVRSYAAVSR